MTNNPSMGMGMHMGGERGPPMNFEQKMKLSPPIANTPDEIRMFAEPQPRSVLDDKAMGLVRDYVGQNPRASDRDVIAYLRNEGYTPSTRDVSLARRILETD